MIFDILLLVLFCLVVFFAARRGFLVMALRLAAWVVAFALSRVLSNVLAEPLYNAFVAEPARRMVESNIGQAVDGSQAVYTAQQVIADLPDALSQLAARVGGITPEYLLDNLDTQQFTENAVYAIERSIIAPIAIAVISFALLIVLFIALLIVCRLIARKLEGLRELPLLRQADWLLGAALGLVKGVLLLIIVALALQAAAALSQEDSTFARMIDASLIITFLSRS